MAAEVVFQALDLRVDLAHRVIEGYTDLVYVANQLPSQLVLTAPLCSIERVLLDGLPVTFSVSKPGIKTSALVGRRDLDALADACVGGSGGRLEVTLPRQKVTQMSSIPGEPARLLRFTVRVQFKVEGSHGAAVQFSQGVGAAAHASTQSTGSPEELSTYLYAGNGGAQVNDAHGGSLTGSVFNWFPAPVHPHAAHKLATVVAPLWRGTSLPRSAVLVAGPGTDVSTPSSDVWSFVTPLPVAPGAVCLTIGPWHAMAGGFIQRPREATAVLAELLTPYAGGALISSRARGPTKGQPASAGGFSPSHVVSRASASSGQTGPGQDTEGEDDALALDTKAPVTHWVCALSKNSATGAPVFPPLHSIAVQASPLHKGVEYKAILQFMQSWTGLPLPAAAYKQVVLPSLVTRSQAPSTVASAPAGEGPLASAALGALEYAPFPGGCALPASIMASSRWPDAALDVRRVMAAGASGAWIGASGLLSAASWRDEWIITGLQGWLALLYIKSLSNEDEYYVRINGMMQAATALEELHGDALPLCPAEPAPLPGLPLVADGGDFSCPQRVDPITAAGPVRQQLLALKATLAMHALSQLFTVVVVQEAVQQLLLGAAHARGLMAQHAARAAAGAAPVVWDRQTMPPSAIAPVLDSPACGTRLALRSLAPVGAHHKSWLYGAVPKSAKSAQLSQLGLQRPSAVDTVHGGSAAGLPYELWWAPEQEATGGAPCAPTALQDAEGCAAVHRAHVVSTRSFAEALVAAGGAGIAERVDSYFRTWIHGTGAGSIAAAYFYNRKKNEADLVFEQTPSPGMRVLTVEVPIRVQEISKSSMYQQVLTEPRQMISIKCHEKVRQLYERGNMRKRTKRDYNYTKKIKRVDRDTTNDTPILWVQLDPQRTLLRRAHIRQPPFMWYEQLRRDKHVIARLDAVAALGLVLTKCYPKAKTKAESNIIARADVDEIGVGSEWYDRGVSEKMQDNIAMLLSHVLEDAKGRFHPAVRAAAAAALAQWQSWRLPAIGLPFTRLRQREGVGMALLAARYAGMFFHPGQKHFLPLSALPNANVAVRVSLLASIVGRQHMLPLFGSDGAEAAVRGVLDLSEGQPGKGDSATGAGSAAKQADDAALQVLKQLGLTEPSSVVTAMQAVLAEALTHGEGMGPTAGTAASVHSSKGSLRSQVMGGVKRGADGNAAGVKGGGDAEMSIRTHRTFAGSTGVRVGQIRAQSIVQRALLTGMACLRSQDGVTPPIALRFLLSVAGDVRADEWVGLAEPSWPCAVDGILAAPLATADVWVRVAAASLAGTAFNGSGHALPVLTAYTPTLASLLTGMASAAADSVQSKAPSQTQAAHLAVPIRNTHPLLKPLLEPMRWEHLVSTGGKGGLPADIARRAEADTPCGLPAVGARGVPESPWLAWRQPGSDPAVVARFAHAVLHRLLRVYDSMPGDASEEPRSPPCSGDQLQGTPDHTLREWLTQDPALEGALLCAALYSVGLLDGASVAPMPEGAIMAVASNPRVPQRARLAAWATLWDGRVAPEALHPPPPPAAFLSSAWRHTGEGQDSQKAIPTEVLPTPEGDAGLPPTTKVPIPPHAEVVQWAQDPATQAWYAWVRWCVCSAVQAAAAFPSLSQGMFGHANASLRAGHGAYGLAGVDDADLNVAPELPVELTELIDSTAVQRQKARLSAVAAGRARMRARRRQEQGEGGTGAVTGGDRRFLGAEAADVPAAGTFGAPAPDVTPLQFGLGTPADPWLPPGLANLWGRRAARPHTRSCLLPLADPSMACAVAYAAGEEVPVIVPPGGPMAGVRGAVSWAGMAAEHGGEGHVTDGHPTAQAALADARLTVRALWGALTSFSAMQALPTLWGEVNTMWHAMWGRYTPAWLWGEATREIRPAPRQDPAKHSRAMTTMRLFLLADAQYAQIAAACAADGCLPRRPRVGGRFDMTEDEAEEGATDSIARENRQAKQAREAEAAAAQQAAAAAAALAAAASTPAAEASSTVAGQAALPAESSEEEAYEEEEDETLELAGEEAALDVMDFAAFQHDGPSFDEAMEMAEEEPIVAPGPPETGERAKAQRVDAGDAGEALRGEQADSEGEDL